MQIDLLGPFAVRVDGRIVDPAEFGGRRVRQLLRLLAAQRGRVVTRDALIEALWGEHPPADPATNLNVIVNRARRALGEADVIRTIGAGYAMRDGSGIIVDAEQFEAGVRRAVDAHARAEYAEAASAAMDALRLWGEPLAEDAYADWARPFRDRLDRLHQDALEVTADALLAVGKARDAVEFAADAVARQPLREPAHLLLVRAYAADGDVAAAVASYLDLRRILADELGLDPSAEATSVYERLLHGTASTHAPQRQRVGLPPLVGRERELAELRGVGSDHRIAVIPARSGWGKSRLLEELCQRTDRRVLFARALVSERDEPWSLARGLLDTPPVAELDLPALLSAPTLAALSDLLPDVDAPTSVADPRSRRALIQQSILRVVETTAPSLVVLDDLQWADSSSLGALAQLVARGSDVALVVAYRPEEVVAGSPVARFVAVLGETHPLEVALPPLGAEALQQLVERPQVAAALAEYTDGSPFAVLQTARTLEREGLLRRGASGGWDAMAEDVHERVREVAHAGQRDTVWRQFERLPPRAQELAALLALVGRPVPVRLVAVALGLEVDEAMRVLRELARGHLVRHDAAGFRADHDLVGETIRDRLDPVMGAQLHQRIADALTATDGPVDEIARHLASAGDAAAATSAYVTAATSRLERYADREAEQLAAEGLALDPAPEERAVLLEVRAETRFRHADLEAARTDLRTALRLTTERTARSRLLTRVAELTAGAVDILEASELAELAVAEAGDDLPARGRALYVRALIARNRLFSVDHHLVEDQRQAIEAQFDEALEIFTEVGDAAGMADIIDARAMNRFGYGDITGGIAQFDRVARLFTDSGNLLRVVMPRSTRGHGLMMARRPQEGLEETAAALELARSLGYGEGEAFVLWHHAELLASCGRPEDALAAADAGLALARRIDHRGYIAINVCAQGVARAALGDLTGAAAAFEETLVMTHDQNLMFAGWAHSRLAQTRLLQGRVDEAAAHVQAALDIPLGLQLYEARLARCELAFVRGDADRASLIDDARRRALEGGHFASAARLDQLAE